MSKKTTLPKLDDAGENIDYLDEDPEIPNQRYCIISFLSPEKIIKQKNEFMFEKFISFLDYDWKVKGIEHLMAFLSKKYSVKIDDLLKDASEFVKVRNAEVKETDIHEQWNIFLLKHEKELQEEFDQLVGFQANIRGVKVRRSFASVEETQNFAKVLQRKYPKDNLFIGKVGAWLPWDPSEHLMPEVEYAEAGLNDMMRKHKENEVNRDMFFEEQKAEAMKRQAEENASRRAQNALSSEAERQLALPAVHPSEGAIRDE